MSSLELAFALCGIGLGVLFLGGMGASMYAMDADQNQAKWIYRIVLGLGGGLVVIGTINIVIQMVLSA